MVLCTGGDGEGHVQCLYNVVHFNWHNEHTLYHFSWRAGNLRSALLAANTFAHSRYLLAQCLLLWAAAGCACVDLQGMMRACEQSFLSQNKINGHQYSQRSVYGHIIMCCMCARARSINAENKAPTSGSPAPSPFLFRRN